MNKRLVTALAAGLIFAAVTPAAHAASTGQNGDAGSPRMNYLLHCSGCHHPDGSGSPESGVPDMREKLGYFLRAPHGREFLIQVPGTSQSRLSHTEVAELMNWMLGTFSKAQVPAGQPPYTEQEVAALRAKPLDDVSGRRADIVKNLGTQGIQID